MNTNTVAALLDELAAAVRPLGALAVTGELTGWRTHRSGRATGDLTYGRPPTARIRVAANRHAAASAIAELIDGGRTSDAAGTVTIHGHITVDPRWGVQLTLLRLSCSGEAPLAVDDDIDQPNKATTWPHRVASIGLIAPGGGDDAHADVIAQLDAATLTIVEHRPTVTGPRAPATIAQALDRLALDPRPDLTLVVRGGGPVSDFTPFDSTLVIAAIGRHPRPVITGLGHAGNNTAADRVAHTACITPTAAAQHILDHLDLADTAPVCPHMFPARRPIHEQR